MKPIRTLVLVADEEHARLFEKAAVTEPLVELFSIEKSDFSDTDQSYSDFPGRSSAAPGMAVHAFDRTATEREQERHVFAAHVLEAAARHLKDGNYKRLAVAAPPKMLGSLRAGMKGPLAKIERFEVDKNLTKETPEDLVARFSDQITL